MRALPGTITAYRPDPRIREITIAAQRRVKHPELYDRIEVLAAQSWLKNH